MKKKLEESLKRDKKILELINKINKKQSTIKDNTVEKYLKEKSLDLSATLDKQK